MERDRANMKPPKAPNVSSGFFIKAPSLASNNFTKGGLAIYLSIEIRPTYFSLQKQHSFVVKNKFTWLHYT